MTDIVRRTVSNVIGTISGIQVSNPTDMITHSGALALVDLDAGDAVRFDSAFKYQLANATDAAHAIVTGIVLARAKAGEAVTVLLQGRMSGWSSLVVGPVYLSDTDGQLSQSAGTVSKKVGWAVNATTIQFFIPIP